MSTAHTRFVEVPASRIDQLFGEIGNKVSGRARVRRDTAGREVVFDICLNSGVVVRTYTSLASGQSKARGCGKDAVRIVVGRLLGSKFQPLSGSRKMLRTAPRSQREDERVAMFVDRLRNNLREAWLDAIKHPVCPSCGSPMKVRKSAKGRFWGCVSYPDCRGTRPLDQEKAGEDRRGR